MRLFGYVRLCALEREQFSEEFLCSVHGGLRVSRNSLSVVLTAGERLCTSDSSHTLSLTGFSGFVIVVGVVVVVFGGLCSGRTMCSYNLSSMI